MVRDGVVWEDGGCGARDYGNEKRRETEAEVITAGWERSHRKHIEACSHLPPSITIPTLWFRLPPSLLFTYNRKLAAANLVPTLVRGAC